MRVLRAGLSEDLGTLLYEIERTMLLDIELAVRPGTDPLGSRANLDAFHEVAAAYGMSAPRINAMIYAGSDGVSAEEGDPGARRSSRWGESLRKDRHLLWRQFVETCSVRPRQHRAQRVEHRHLV